jgi:hypothetical protein
MPLIVIRSINVPEWLKYRQLLKKDKKKEIICEEKLW